ncbi:hulk isoform X4 [Lycorma delicatula]|uniref:hulk isoform X4 n=1 Tax=Lycorma delicatula TaxID=130591 RepID=UPI003F517782
MVRWWLVLLLAGAVAVHGKKQGAGENSKEPVIEEVTAKQLERVLNEKDFVAVFWYARSCITCDKVLEELEKIDDDTDSFGVDFVKINDKRLAKHYGIKNFPALTYFREKEPIIYEGDLMDEENVLDFLTSLEAMDLPDRIEEVNAKILEKIIEDTEFVAVLFYKPQCKKCSKALQELENIDDEADQLGIGFVKIADEALADEYNLGELPKLVYYRHQIPIIYEQELTREEDVLEWLVQNKSTGDEEDVIEDVTAKTLDTLIGSIDNLVVLFYDNDDEDSIQVLGELEKIDDDCDKHGIQFVKIDDNQAAKDFGIDNVPAIVYFEKQIPNVYDGDIENEDEILEWLIEQLEKDEIEDVTDEMLDRLVKEGKTLAVLFYDNNDRKSQRVLNELENIDDECDALGIVFVKLDNSDEAKNYGIEKLPALMYFEKGIPMLYEGNLEEEEKVLNWLDHQQRSDEIEDVTDEMLDMIIEKMPHVAALFYDKDQKKSQKVLAELENIDDECDQNDIAFVKIDNDEEAKEYGVESLPALIFFEKRIPHIYDGDLMKEEELLSWLIHQKRHSEIAEVTDEILDKLIDSIEFLAVLFYEKEDKQDIRVLNELENIDDELDKEGIVIVRIDNKEEAKEYGIDHLPTLVYFENKIPAIYEGELLNEEEVLEWLLEQKNSATIEEVTDEILKELINEHEYVVVYFSGRCEEGQKCDSILDELENIDDELDENGMVFVTTEDTALAKKHGIKSFPSLVLFRNKEPLMYKGDIEDEDEVLSWLTDDDTMEIPGRIEEVNTRMLEKILSENENVVVFFYKEGDKKSQKIISELENIDDECEEKDIDFVKTSDEGIDKEYDLPSLPALVFYRNKFRKIYSGDLMQEEAILEWVLDLHESEPDVIESVDRKTLQVLINDVEHLAVFFYDDKCESCPEILEELETIDDDTDDHGIQFVKSKDSKLASEIGIFSFPALVYYETGVPIMYDGNLQDEKKVLEWMIKQKTDESIEDIDRETLFKYIETKEFLAVAFYVEDDPNTPRVLRHIELIDDEAAEYGIKIVKCNDRLMAKKYGFRNPPGLTYFRKGKHINYDGDIDDDEELLDWLTDPANMELTEQIERINRKMFGKLRQTSDYIAVFFYSDDCKQCDRVLAELEHIDDEADGAGIDFVKIDDKKLAKELGVFALPAVLFFKMGSKEPVIYAGDLYDEGEILNWLLTQKDPSGEVIEELEGEELLRAIHKSESLAVYFWNKTLCELCSSKAYRKMIKKHHEDPDAATTEEDSSDSEIDDDHYDGTPEPDSHYPPTSLEIDKADECEQCKEILEELENIDDDCDRHGITFVKTQDFHVAESFGVSDFPSLVYFEHQIPNVFEGNLAEEEEVLQWLITQRTEDRIELITRTMLESMVEETQYLAVYFYKLSCNICDTILEGLEKIDDECDVFGIHMVKIQDPQLAKRYSIKTFPALVYFRNGNPLLFEGDLQNEESVLEWLIDDDNRELADEIEEVNSRMLERLLDESLFLAVFFYDEDCPECEEILEELEMIDGEADLFGIDMVKISDSEAATKYNIINTPSLVYFRKRVPLLYDGDLLDEEKILQWLTSQDVFEIKNEIEEVNRKMLDKLLEENEYLAVYFYDSDEEEESQQVLDKLEKIDSETENMDVTFVKMADPRYARKWGVTKLPAVVYFRNRFPSIYRGEFSTENEVLEWLRKNRYRQPELNLFMYALFAITLAFVLYTAFLLYGFQQPPKQV